MLDREELINAIWANRGRVGLVAESMGVSNVTIYAYAKKYATVKQAIMDAQSQTDALLVDTAETKTQQLVIEGHWPSIRYVLSTKGKTRGWVERQEIAGPDGEPLTIRLDR